MKILNVLLVGCFVVFASCEYGLPDRKKPSDDDTETGGKSGGSGSGGVQDDSGTGQPDGEDDAGAEDADQPEPGDECPSGFRCTAPGGAFVCTEQQTGFPPFCQEDTDCKFGTCTEYAGLKYCVQECGPAAIEECPPASVCNRLFDGANVCAQSILWNAPPCQTQDDCPFGECLLSYSGLNLCIQPCESTVVQECPGDSKCVPREGKFYCADPLSGVPATCSSDDDCEDYGRCVPYYDQGYCTQECLPRVVDRCSDDSVCRFLSPFGFYCSDPSTLVPSECESQEDCTYGTCIRYGNTAYCTEYCSQPGIEIIGTVLGTDGEGVEGVEVCLFDGEAPDENNCTETDATGQFALVRLDEFPYFVISMTKEGYQSSLQLAYANQLTSALIFTEEEMADTADALGVEYAAEDTGVVVFVALGAEESLADFTVELMLGEGEGPYGDGPFYANEDWELVDSDSLDAASNSGWGAYFNVSTGTYFLDFSGADQVVCGDLPAVTVVDGYLSVVVSYCYEWEIQSTE